MSDGLGGAVRGSLRRTAPAYGPEDAAADGDGDADADHSGETPGDAGVADVLDAVVGERGVGRSVFLDLLVDAPVGGDLLQAVGARGGVEGDEAREEERGDQARCPDLARGAGGRGAGASDAAGAAGASTSSPSTRSLSGVARPRAPCTRSGRTAITAPTVSAVITASPMPIRTWTPTIAVNTLPMGTSVVPPIA